MRYNSIFFKWFQPAVFFCILCMAFTARSQEIYLYEQLWPASQQSQFFNSPRAITLDAEGYVYVADTLNHRVQKLNSNGQFVTAWGSQGSGDEQFNLPAGIAVDCSGHVYVADAANYRIKKYTTSGQFLAAWGGPGSGPGQFDWIPAGASQFVVGMALDLAGNLYVTDAGNDRIQIFSSAGDFIAQWTGNFSAPSGIAIDASGDVLVVDQSNVVQKFAPDGTLLDSWGTIGSNEGQLEIPAGIAIDPSGFIYVSDRGEKSNILKFTPSGVFLVEIGIGIIGACPAVFRKPLGLAADSNGNLFVADEGNNRIQKLDPEGQFLVALGSYGREPGELLWPGGIDLDAGGNVYVADVYNNRVQKFTVDGDYLAHLGQLYAEELWLPTDICVDGSGNVFVTDTYRHQIAKMNSDLALPFYFGGQGSANGLFEFPAGITTDSQGNVYVADAGNYRIQKFTNNGAYITQWGSQGSGAGQFIWSELDGRVFSAYWEVDFVIGLAIDADDNIYVVDRGNHRVQKFSATGTFLGQFGSQGSSEGQFNYPSGICIAPGGHIFVTDSENCRVQEFDPDAFQFVAQWGQIGTQPGQMNMPVDVTVNTAGKVFVTDSGGNNRVQVFKKIDPPVNKAIVVAGGGPYPGNNLWAATQACANFAYRTLAYQGFTKETICYLSSDVNLDLDNNGEADDVDHDASNANLEDVLTIWAVDADSLIVYLVDHGGAGTFRMSGTETLAAGDLDTWLDQLQETITGHVTVVYDACEAGSFVAGFEPPQDKERIVIGSTAPGESAYFITHGSISFSSYFWSQIFNGADVQAAFDAAAQAIGVTTDFQNPVLTEAGRLAANTFIGNHTAHTGDVPIITAISPSQNLDGTNSALLFAENVLATSGIARVWAVIRPPDYNQGSSDNPVQELPWIDLQATGSIPERYAATYPHFNIDGTYHVAVYARDRSGGTSMPTLTTVTVNNPLARKALILAGGPLSDPLWPTFSTITELAYNTLSFQGYSDDDIYLLSPDDTADHVDALTTRGNLDQALATWAQDGTQDMVIYLAGHGRHGSFQLNTDEFISSTELDDRLDTLQTATAADLIVILDTSRSGSFLEALVPPEGTDRIMLASTGPHDPAYFLSEGDISFSAFFWRQVLNGANLRDAFNHTINAMGTICPDQVPLLDDSGNGIGNEMGVDGRLARAVTLGVGIMLAGDDPVIGAICPDQTLSGSPEATIWVDDVTTTGVIQKVWALIRPPGFEAGDPLQPVAGMPMLELTATGNGRYEGQYDAFDVFGAYDIAVYAMDAEQNVSLPATTRVEQSIGPDVCEPDDGFEQANALVIDAATPVLNVMRHNLHDFGDQDWFKFLAFEGKIYEFWVKNPGDLCDAVIALYQPDGITLVKEQSLTFEGEDELMNWACPQGGDGIYYVKIRGLDPNIVGIGTEYELVIYDPVMPFPGYIEGTVTNAVSGTAVGNAVIVTSGNVGCFSHSSGYFLMIHPPGDFTLNAQCTGYEPTSHLITISEATLTNRHIALAPLKGDINSDGSVDLTDVVLTLQVMAGIDTTGLVRPDYAGSNQDVNMDLRVGLEEALFVLQHLAELR